MGRYLGPKHRICRRAGEKLCDLDRCPALRRGYPPGVHGPRLRRKMTEYGTQLLEKQKARAVYGILERQLRKYYAQALSSEGDTSHILAQLLESRLDSVVFRLAMAKTRSAARQLISHGHITVNGKKMTIPSYCVRSGDIIGVKDRSRGSSLFSQYSQVAAQAKVPEWLAVDAQTMEGRVLRLPTEKDAQTPFRIQSIVEFYSR